MPVKNETTIFILILRINNSILHTKYWHKNWLNFFAFSFTTLDKTLIFSSELLKSPSPFRAKTLLPPMFSFFCSFSIRSLKKDFYLGAWGLQIDTRRDPPAAAVIVTLYTAVKFSFRDADFVRKKGYFCKKFFNLFLIFR